MVIKNKLNLIKDGKVVVSVECCSLSQNHNLLSTVNLKIEEQLLFVESPVGGELSLVLKNKKIIFSFKKNEIMKIIDFLLELFSFELEQLLSSKTEDGKKRKRNLRIYIFFLKFSRLFGRSLSVGDIWHFENCNLNFYFGNYKFHFFQRKKHYIGLDISLIGKGRILEDSIRIRTPRKEFERVAIVARKNCSRGLVHGERFEIRKMINNEKHGKYLSFIVENIVLR